MIIFKKRKVSINMSKITKVNEIELPTVIVGCIYGSPGAGKSSLALSAPKPLLIDTDGGIHRVQAEYRCDTVQVKSYQDILDVLTENLSEYQSIIIDTLGELVNFMLKHFTDKDPSLVTRGGTMNIKVWGLVKSEFNQLKFTMKSLNKNLIFVAHQAEDKDGDKKVYRLDVAGSSGKDIVKILDFLGYMEMVGKRRTISFAPCDRYYAKNSIKLDDMIQIPILDDGEPNTFITDKMIKPSIERRKQEQVGKANSDALLAQGRSIISKSKDPNATIQEFKAMDLPLYVSLKLFEELKASTELQYNEESKRFE